MNALKAGSIKKIHGKDANKFKHVRGTILLISYTGYMNPLSC
jgi:hypothetical protein